MSIACEGMSVHYASVDCFSFGLCTFRFAGYIGKGYDEVIVEGDVDKQQFVAYYVKDNRVRRLSHFISLSLYLSSKGTKVHECLLSPLDSRLSN